MKLTDEQIQRVKRLIPSQPSRLDREAIIALLADRQAWKEEVEELKEENQRLADNYNRDVYSADTEIIKLQNQLNQAVEVIERVLRFAKENSDDSRYLEQVQAELEHFLSQEGGKHAHFDT